VEFIFVTPQFHQWILTFHFSEKCTSSILRLKGSKNSLITGRVKGKGKAVPLQAWSGPEGSRKLRFPDFMTMAQDAGKVVSLTHWPPLPPGNTSHFC